jgi:hypothetical protein
MSQAEFHTRVAKIRAKMLDALGDIVDMVGQRAALRAQLRAQVEAAIYGEMAPLTCRKAACRRAQRCRGEPLACIERARADARSLSAGP